MEIFLAIVILVASFILIVYGGNKFVDSSVQIAKKLKIPTPIIGATLVSVGTTIPELLVTIFSSTSSASGLAVGNAVGSMLFNACLIGGVLLACVVITINKSVLVSFSILIFSVVYTFLIGLNKNISPIESAILLVIFVVFILFNYLGAKNSKEEIKNETKINPIWLSLVVFVISAAMIGVGAYFMVEKAKFLAKAANISDTIIGLTVISFGTSLPELITSISAIRKKEPGLGIGNIVGSNIINCTLLIGLTGVINANTGLLISASTLYISLPIVIASTLVLLLPTIIKKRTHKWQGACLIGMYTLYYIYLILEATGVILM